MFKASSSELFRRRWSRFSGSSAGNVAQTFAARIFLLITNLGTGILVARALAPAGRGEQAAMALWPGLLCGLCTLGVPLALNYNCRRFPERRLEFVWASLVLGLILGFVAAAIGVFIIPHMLTRYDRSAVVFAQWMMMIAPFTMITFVLQATLESGSDFTTSNLSKSLPQVASLILLLTLAALGRLTPFSSTAAYICPLTVVPIFLVWKLRKDILVEMTRFRESVKQLLSYGARSYIVDVLGTLSQQVDQVLVVGIISATGLGLYTVALSVSRVLGVFHSSLVTVLFPKASSLETDDVVALTGRAARVSTFIAALGAVLLVLILPIMMVRLYGGSFRAVVPVARILSFEIVVTGATSILSQAFMATGRPGTIAMLQAIGVSLTVPFMLLLIPRFGLIGAATALLLSSSCRLGMTLSCFPLILKSKVPNMLVTQEDLEVLWTRVRQLV